MLGASHCPTSYLAMKSRTCDFRNLTVPDGSLANGMRFLRIQSSSVRTLILRNSAVSGLFQTASSGGIRNNHRGICTLPHGNASPKFDGYLSENIRRRYFNSASFIPARWFAASDLRR